MIYREDGIERGCVGVRVGVWKRGVGGERERGIGQGEVEEREEAKECWRETRSKLENCFFSQGL